MKKTTRIIAGALVASMMFSITACGKEGNFTAKKFKKVSLENLDAEEWDMSDYDLSDEEDLEELYADIVADLEDGIYVTRTGEEIMDDDNYDEDVADILYSVLDIDLDYEDVDSVSAYAKGSMEDEDDFYLISSSVIEFKDAKASAAFFQSILHNLKRGTTIANAICDTEMDVENLDKDTYIYNGKNSGHIVIKLSADDLDIDEIDDIDGDITLVIGLYIEGKDVFGVVSICNDSEGNDDITEFFKLMGMKNPYELESTEAVVDFINDVYENSDEIYKKWEKKFQNSNLSSVADQYI